MWQAQYDLIIHVSDGSSSAVSEKIQFQPDCW